MSQLFSHKSQCNLSPLFILLDLHALFLRKWRMLTFSLCIIPMKEAQNPICLIENECMLSEGDITIQTSYIPQWESGVGSCHPTSTAYKEQCWGKDLYYSYYIYITLIIYKLQPVERLFVFYFLDPYFCLV